MQTALSFRTNRDLFSNYYLDEHLPETEAWDELNEDELQDAKDDIMELWEREKETAPKRNESQLEEKFIRPMFRKLGIPFEVEESTSRTQRRPDYGFFESEDAARGAFERREEGGDFYRDAVAVADAKRWGRPLDTRGSGEHERDFENPSYQIHVYLQEVDDAQWAVLTDGKKWRLYYGPTSHRLDSYYEIDLPTVLEQDDLEDFKYFYLFFRHEAFLEDSSGECFLDDVYDESNVYARELGEDLQDNIYEAIKVLSEGFMQYPDNDLSEDDLDLIHDSSLIYLYRVIFVLYSEAEGRELLDTDNEIYEESYSLNSLKQEIAEELDSPSPKYRDWQDNLWDRLDELFKLIDQGSKSRGIPEEDLYIPAYNGGLFRTDPDDDDSAEARFLATHQVGDAYLAEIIELLTRSQNGNGGGKIFVDYSSLDVRHLGSIYEGLLEYQLDVADEPLALEDGEYVPAGEGDEVIVEQGEVHLVTGSGERKATGSYYTPEYVVEYIVEETLGPLVDDIRENLVGQSGFDEGGFAEEFAEEVFDLKILDPAMGSGHFLTSAVDYLAREIIDAQERQAAQQGIETVDEEHDINWARRQVAQRCIYGVDLNPLAVELAKVSLWLRTLAAEQPLAFLDHHLKTGNSLVGSDIETVLDNGDSNTEQGQLTLRESFDRTRRRAIEHVTDQFEELLAIDNETLSDVKEMEAVFEEARDDPLYQHLIEMANVHTAEQFGLDIPQDAYRKMAAALQDDSWNKIEDQDWFRSAQDFANEEHFFHWELEFPIAFYGHGGERSKDGGFDAVIGNPPYVRMEVFKEIKEFLSVTYQTHASRTDLYVYFMEKSVNLLSENSQFGMIVSNKFLKAKYGKKLRKYLGDSMHIKNIVDFGELPVFDEASTMPLIFLGTSALQEYNPIYAQVTSLEFDSLANEVDQRGYEVDPSDLRGEDWRLVPQAVSDVMEKVNIHGRELESLVENPITYGIKTGLNDAFIIDSSTREELVRKDSRSEECIKPMVVGDDVRKYHIDWDGKWLIYMPKGIDIGKYQAIKEHLEPYREDLENRALDQKWYELQQPQEEYSKYFEGPQIVYPDIAMDPRFAFSEGPIYPATTCFTLPGNNHALLAHLNSTLTFFYLSQICSSLGIPSEGGRLRLKHQYMHQLPIWEPISNYEELEGPCISWLEYLYKKGLPGDDHQQSGDKSKLKSKVAEMKGAEPLIEREVDKFENVAASEHSQLLAQVKQWTSRNGNQSRDAVVSFLGHLSKMLINYYDEESNLNLNLLDYLGSYSDGESMSDIGLYQPSEPNTLNGTTDEKDNLRIGDVKTKRNDDNVTVWATARFKPEDGDNYEIDQWGYTETDYLEAFTITNITSNEATLIEEFVPVAADNEIGGFMEEARKSISLLDRLKDITLPDMDDVFDDLNNYTKTKRHADELHSKITETEQIIDEITYIIYDLTDEEIEIVESAVQDD